MGGADRLSDPICYPWLAVPSRLDVDVRPVGEVGQPAAVGRLVSLGEELETDLEARLGRTAVGVQVHRLRHQLGSGAEQPTRFVREDVRVAADLVHRPRRRLTLRSARHMRAPDHVVHDEASAHRLAARAARRHVVDLADLHRAHVAVRLERDRDRLDLTPPIRGIAFHRDLVRRHDQVRPDRPRGGVAPLDRLGQVRRVALRSTVVDPRLDERELLVREGRVVLVVLDADVLLDVPRRHGAHAVADRRAPLDLLGVAADVLIRDQRHRAGAVGPVAGLAAPLQDRFDVRVKGGRGGVCARDPKEEQGKGAVDLEGASPRHGFIPLVAA